MAIQIRRGTNAGWEASKTNIVVGEPAVTTDTERAFIGTGSGTYMELANLERIAPAYDTSAEYAAGDIVSWQGELYKAIAPTSGAFNVAYWEKMTFADILKDFNEHMYDGYETNTIENVDIASFDNGAGGIAVKDLQVDIEAVQYLHGYSHPWVGGAGKNLFDKSLMSDVKTGSTTKQITLEPNTTYIAQTTLPKNNNDSANWFVFNSSGSADTNTNGLWNGQTRTVTTNADGIVKFMYRSLDFTDTSATFFFNHDFQIEKGSTATAYEPYSNICPIGGWAEVVVNVAGKNLFDEVYTNISADIIYRPIYVGDGTFTMSTTTPRHRGSANLFFFAGQVASGASTSANGVWDGQNRTLQSINGYVTVGYRIVDNSQPESPANFQTQIELGSAATAYEPYNGSTYTTDLGQVVYGGTLDVTTGVLTVTHASKLISDLSNWNINTAGTHMRFYSGTLLSDAKLPSAQSVNANIMSDSYKAYSFSQLYGTGNANGGIALNTNGALNVTDANYSTANEFLTAKGSTRFVYELATPQTYQLSPQEVETVYKNNNIWCMLLAFTVANSGNIKVLVYRMTRH